MKNIVRHTQVVSLSFPKKVVEKMERARKDKGQTRSGYISNLIMKASEDEAWLKLYDKGEETGRKFKITSEDDIDRILHEA